MRAFAAEVAAAIGRGICSGLIGTAAMTASTTLEMKVRGRRASETPAEALCTLLGIEAVGEEEKARLSRLVHWGYGTSLGALRGLLGLGGLRGRRAMSTFFGVAWGGAAALLPALGVSRPITEWEDEQILTDAAHHLVYALAASLAYEYLDRG